MGKLVLVLVPTPDWPRFDEGDVEGMRVSMAAFASSMLTFMVYAVSALLLAIQLASGQITPRIIRMTFSRWEMKVAAGVFVFAFGITMVALANTTDQVRHGGLIVLAIVGNVVAIAVFFWFVEEVGLGLRPVTVLQKVFADGKGGDGQRLPGRLRCRTGGGPGNRPGTRGARGAHHRTASVRSNSSWPSGAANSWRWRREPAVRSS